MAIEIQDGFRISTNKPVDDRYVKASQLERDSIPAEMRYLGLKCYVTGDEVEYILKEGLTNDDWEPVGEGDVSGPTSSGDERLARWDGVTGKQLQSSGVILDDSDNMSGVESVTTNAVNVGTLRVSESVDNTSTADAMIVANTSRVILTNALLESIAGISAPTVGKETTIVNKTGRIVRVVHNHTGFLLDNRFILPDAKDISLRPDASITVISSASYGAHVVKGGSGSGGGSQTLETLMQLTADEPISEWSNITGGFSISKVDPLFGDASYVLEMTNLKAATYKVIPVDIGFRGTTVALTLNYLMLDGTARVELLDQDNNLIDGTQFDIPAANGKEKFGTIVFIPSNVTGIRFKAESRATVAGGSFKFDNVQLSSDVLGVIDYSTIPVGTIIESMLTEAQIQAQAGAGIILADGRDVTGSRYHAITGNTTVPDLRGVFLRGKANGSDKDVERGLGDYQADAFQGHYHSATGAATSGTGGFFHEQGTSSSFAANNSVRAPQSDGINGTPRTASETRPKNVTVNYFIKINDTNLSIVAPTDQVTERSIAFRYRNASQNLERVGDYWTYTYAANTNTVTKTTGTNRPNQTDADMSVNGVRIFTRLYDVDSSSAQPVRFEIKIAEPNQMGACDLVLYKDTSRTIQGSLDVVISGLGNAVMRGAMFRHFNPATGILTIDGGFAINTATVHSFQFEDNSNDNNGYITFTASKLAQGVAIPKDTSLRASLNTGQVNDVTNRTVIYNQVVYDTTHCYDPITGVFTANRPMLVDLTANYQHQPSTTWIPLSTFNIKVYVNDEEVMTQGQRALYSEGITSQMILIGAQGIPLNQGDTLRIVSNCTSNISGTIPLGYLTLRSTYV